MRVAPRTAHLPIRWVEPWYLAYALPGLAVAGAVPILLPLLVSRLGSHSWLVLVGCTLVVLCWAGLSVSSTTLTAHCAPENEGEGMGLLNATSALAGVFGAVLGGWVAARRGYHAALGLAVGDLTLGLCLSLTVRPKQ